MHNSLKNLQTNNKKKHDKVKELYQKQDKKIDIYIITLMLNKCNPSKR